MTFGKFAIYFSKVFSFELPSPISGILIGSAKAKARRTQTRGILLFTLEATFTFYKPIALTSKQNVSTKVQNRAQTGGTKFQSLQFDNHDLWREI